ncbi:MAG TPA: tRNA adenosine(34) deaminase TadA [Atribacteraceae bacterium]|nr:tRNA adenosine(34) deaminase TadA [Atribacteraceae bacterium]
MNGANGIRTPFGGAARLAPDKVKNQEHERYMAFALREAEKAFREDEVPVGACLVLKGEVVARGHNRRERKNQVISHAEIEVLQKAARRLGSWRLPDAVLYVTLEPCLMCAGAILQARIQTVVFGTRDPKGGVAGSVIDVFSTKLFNHRTEIIEGIYREGCSQILQKYFTMKRQRGEVAESG